MCDNNNELNRCLENGQCTMFMRGKDRKEENRGNQEREMMKNWVASTILRLGPIMKPVRHRLLLLPQLMSNLYLIGNVGIVTSS